MQSAIQRIFLSLASPLLLSSSRIRHLAIILDGNRRWAREQGQEASAGHEAGAEALMRTIEGMFLLGTPVLTAYVLSTDNLHRPKAEVEAIGHLAGRYLAWAHYLAPELEKYNCTITITGHIEVFPDPLVRALAAAVSLSRSCVDCGAGEAGGRKISVDKLLELTDELASRIDPSLTRAQAIGAFTLRTRRSIGSLRLALARRKPTKHILNLCFCYSSQQETVDAVENLISAGGIDAPLSPPSTPTLTPQHCCRHAPDKQALAAAARTTGAGIELPEVDAVVRTGGDRRLSDFLLLETTRAAAPPHLCFLSSPWPEFGWKQLTRVYATVPLRRRAQSNVLPAHQTSVIASCQRGRWMQVLVDACHELGISMDI